MLTRSKSTLVGFAVLAVMAAGGVYFFDVVKTARNWVSVTATVKFDPAVKHQPVSVVIAIDALPKTVETATTSPFVETVQAHRGSIVTLAAAHPAGSGTMTCLLQGDHRKVGPVPADLTPKPGFKGCLISFDA